VLILAGAYEYSISLATVTVQPIEWGINPDGSLAITPLNGATYNNLTMLGASVKAASGVVSVTMTIGTTQYVLHLTAGPATSGVWTLALTPPITASGIYQFGVGAQSNLGNAITYIGSFTIYTGLQGYWYINNIQILSTSQSVPSEGNTVAFGFKKTSGIADSSISCYVKESGSTLSTLSNTASGIWNGTYTFANGNHVLTLQAYDGTTTITMNIVSLASGTLPSENTTPMRMFDPLFLFAIGSVVMGYGVFYAGKRKVKE
jgi:hypothetical protein